MHYQGLRRSLMPRESDFIPIIGLEVHVEPKTKSKMFCACSAQYFGKAPNTHVCPICLGLPGTLPVPNGTAIQACITLGLALGCSVNLNSKFDRKHYFYPDLSKGYQISQYDKPFCTKGVLTIGNTTLGIRRVHMEEDTAKLVHEGTHTLIDFNRSGVPLIEIVSEPDLHDPMGARKFLAKLQQIIRYAGISDADMEKGTMRCEVNISLTKPGAQNLPAYKVEIKNLNSFKSVERALIYEVNRQTRQLSLGAKVMQETRGWEEDKGKTRSQRVKEEAQDYRYFPEPDIPPIGLEEGYVDKLRRSLPELPDIARERLMRMYALPESQVDLIIRTKEGKEFFEHALRAFEQVSQKDRMEAAKEVTRWTIGELERNLTAHKKTYVNLTVQPAALGELLYLKERGRISEFAAKQILSQMVRTGTSPTALIKKLGLAQISDHAEYQRAVAIVLSEHKKAAQDFLSGRQTALGFLMGQVQKVLHGRGDPQVIRKALLEKLSRRT